ncbi:MAG: TM2 domain-containing protein [Oligoflexia bacterium]|nr:TM2 domain-containing protein [Oligoflexia bacterium]
MHHIPIGYLFWLFGFTGSHRFYYGRPMSGTLYFFTFGLLGIGWIIDLFLIPSMDRQANREFKATGASYTVAWALLTFCGILGLHRFYLGKWITGIIWLLTGGFFLIGYLYDYWTLNDQVEDVNNNGWIFSK